MNVRRVLTIVLSMPIVPTLPEVIIARVIQDIQAMDIFALVFYLLAYIFLVNLGKFAGF